jgi:hypothetical protein
MTCRPLAFSLLLLLNTPAHGWAQARSRDSYLPQARRLMREAPFIDTHNDLPEMLRLKAGFDL